MEDIKKIQEFFSKPLEEGKQLDQVDFAKVVKAVEQTGHPVTVLLVPKFNEIEVLTGMNAPDDMLRDLSNAVDSLGYGRNDIIIAGDSSNLSRREYSNIFRVNGGAKDYFEESVEEVTRYSGFNRNPEDPDSEPFKPTKSVSEFTEDLRSLFGKFKGDLKNPEFIKGVAQVMVSWKSLLRSQLDEYGTGIYYKGGETQDKAKDAGRSAADKVKDFIKKIVKEEEITVDDATEFKINLKHLLDKHAIKESKPKKGHGEKIAKDVFAKLQGKVVNYKGEEYKVVSSDDAVLRMQDEDGNFKSVNLNQFNIGGMIKEIMETIELGKNLNEELCAKGKAYRKKRMAAGEKSSAYLSGRAVKVCKGQMKG